MSLSGGHLIPTVSRDSKQSITVAIREDDSNLLIGYVQITLVPTGARVEGWHGNNDAEADGQIILHAEKP